MAATATALSPYEVVSDAGLTLGKQFYGKGARLGLTADQAYYLELSGSVRSLVGQVLDPLPVYVPPPVGPIVPTESNTLVGLTVSGLQTFVTVENLVNLFPKLRAARGLTGGKGDRGDKGDKGDRGDVGPSVTVNGHTGPVITVTASDVGLGNVANLSPANMPVSSAQAQAIAFAVSTILDQIASGGDVDLDTLSAIVATKASKAELTAAFTQIAGGVSSSANTLGKLEALLNVARAATTALSTRVDNLPTGGGGDTSGLAALVATKASQADLVGLAVDTLDAISGKADSTALAALGVATLEAVNSKADLSVVTALTAATLDAVNGKVDVGGDASLISIKVAGAQTISNAGVGNPTALSSLVVNATRRTDDQFEIVAQFNATSSRGAGSAGGNPGAGQTVALSTGMQVNPGSGGGYCRATVLQVANGVSGVPCVADEIDVNYNGADSGNTDAPFAGGTLIAPVFAQYFAGIGSGKLSAIVGIDLFGYQTSQPIGLASNRGIVFFNGVFARGTIEDYTKSMYVLRAGGQKTDSGIHLADAVIDTNIAVRLGITHSLTWRSSNGSSDLALIRKDSTDALSLGNGFVTRMQPAANLNVKVAGDQLGIGAPTIQAVNDANTANIPLAFVASAFGFYGGPINANAGLSVKIDGALKAVSLAPAGSIPAGYKALVVAA